MPTSLPYALLLYQCRSTCSQETTTQDIGSQLRSPASLKPSVLPQPHQGHPFITQAHSQASFLASGIPASDGGTYRLVCSVPLHKHLSIKGMQIKCRNREGPSLHGDELRADSCWVEL